MRQDKKFKLDIFGLKNGVHEYPFEFGNELFERFENGLIEKGNGTCLVVLTKKDSLMELRFEIAGKIELTCDRSLEKFNHAVELTESLILKYGEAFDDSRDDLWIIPNQEQSINIAQPLYEYLLVAVPMKKLHPRFADDAEEGLELVYSSDEDESFEEKENDESDPRWDALKNIKNLN